MKKIIGLTILIVLLSGTTIAQKMDKKYKTLKVERIINAPAKKVWETMVLDYGNISNFSPYIFASKYESGSLKGELGAERKCNLSEDGKMWAHEKIVAIDYENMTMKNTIVAVNKMPLDIDNSYAIYSVKNNGDGTSTAGYEFNFRTKPAIMGTLAKGNFKKTLNGTLIGLKHYIETGNRVTPTSGNYKQLVKAHKKAGTY